MNPIIEVDRISKKFGNFTAVNELSFTVYRNEIFGLLGPNGAGKTTTISMICGLIKPDAGNIRFMEQALIKQKSAIGYCSQENIFYPKLTCLEQLVFVGNMYGIPVKVAKKSALRLLELMGLTDKSNALASELSGGMKRRLNICMALIHDPEILIFDEPEAGLDPQSRILVRDFIRGLGQQKTVILTTHNMDEADRLADRIAIMDYGKLLMLDSPANLKNTIGSGDMLEMVISSPGENQMNDFTGKISAIAGVMNQGGECLIIKHHNILDVLPSVKKIAEDCGVTISEYKLRENTLEDVFIRLTGRNLRQ